MAEPRFAALRRVARWFSVTAPGPGLTPLGKSGLGEEAGGVFAGAAAGCMTPGLEAAAMRRRMAGWQPASLHVNALLQNAGDSILARARWLVRNNGYARAAIRSWSSATVGAGIKPSSLVEDADLRDAINTAWLRWTDEADSENNTDFYGLQRRISREAFLAGEVFVQFRPRFPEDGLYIPLQLQLLPSEQLGTSETLEEINENNTLRMGIEFDGVIRDRRLAYWFYRANPTDSSLSWRDAYDANELVRVPASEVIHIFDPVEAGQIRGLSGMAAAMVRLFMLDSYDDAELERKRQIARYATFIKRPDFRQDGGLPFTDEDDSFGLNPRPGGSLESGDQYMPGATVVLYPGEDVTFSSPGEVGNSFEPFQYRCLLNICAALGIPYHELSADLNRTTYASSRAGLLAFRQEVEAFQHAILVFQFLRRVWNRWMDAAVLAGRLPISPAAYARDPARYRAMKAITPKAAWVDPLKDRQAEVLALRAGIKSPQDVIEAEGYDLEEVYNRIAEANDLAAELGIRVDYGWSAGQQGGTQPQKATAVQPPQPQQGQRGAA